MLTFAWLEGSRSFSILLGTVLAGVSLALAFPILWWYLPKHRRWIFPKEADPRQRWQLGFGLVCMGMTFTNALCRYIPHSPLGYVHPVFFFTTIGLAVVLLSRMLTTKTALAASLTAFIAVPVTSVVAAFWR